MCIFVSICTHAHAYSVSTHVCLHVVCIHVLRVCLHDAYIPVLDDRDGVCVVETGELDCFRCYFVLGTRKVQGAVNVVSGGEEISLLYAKHFRECLEGLGEFPEAKR
jgi:hypothetical protein